MHTLKAAQCLNVASRALSPRLLTRTVARGSVAHVQRLPARHHRAHTGEMVQLPQQQSYVLYRCMIACACWMALERPSPTGVKLTWTWLGSASPHLSYATKSAIAGASTNAHLQVRATFERQWCCKLPGALCAYINDDKHVTKDIRLAALLAWMRCHASALRRQCSERWCSWWGSWLEVLPAVEDVPVLWSAQAAELSMMEDHAPHLATRARLAVKEAASAWQTARTTHPHVWLSLTNMTPGSFGPVSYPIGVRLQPS